MNSIHNPAHPFWGFARIIAVLVCLTVTLWASASHFDHTELQVIGVMFLAVIGAESVPKMFRRKSEDTTP